MFGKQLRWSRGDGCYVQTFIEWGSHELLSSCRHVRIHTYSHSLQISTFQKAHWQKTGVIPFFTWLVNSGWQIPCVHIASCGYVCHSAPILSSKPLTENARQWSRVARFLEWLPINLELSRIVNTVSSLAHGQTPLRPWHWILDIFCSKCGCDTSRATTQNRTRIFISSFQWRLLTCWVSIGSWSSLAPQFCPIQMSMDLQT